MTTLLHQLQPVGLGFLDTAPVRFDFEAELPAPPAEVFATISADPGTWTWFPGLAEGRYESAAPHGVGSTRAVVMDGTTFRDTILAGTRQPAGRTELTKAPSRPSPHSPRIGSSNADEGGSVLRWTFAVQPQPELVELIAGARETIDAVFAKAMAGLTDVLG